MLSVKRCPFHQNDDVLNLNQKGFPAEHPTLIDEIQKLFETYGEVNSVRLRREETKERTFKVGNSLTRRSFALNALQGSVYVEYKDLASAQKFLEADPKPQFNGADLTIYSKSVPYLLQMMMAHQKTDRHT